VDRPPLVLIDGGDPTLVADALARVVDELVGGEDRSLVVEDHAYEEVDLAAVADGCATPPLLAGHRVVVLRDVGRWSTEELAPLLAYLEQPLPTTTVVAVAGGGQTPARLVAAAKAGGRVVATRVDTRRPDDWVRQRVRDAGLTLTPPALARLTSHLGEDPGRLVPILAVLDAAFGAGERIGPDDLEPYLGQAGGVTPWELTDSIDEGASAEALVKLHRLLEGGRRHPLVVLSILQRHVVSLLRVDSPDIRSEADAAAALGLAAGRSTFPARKALRAARRWGSTAIIEAVGLVADAEVDLKGASSWPAEAVLEVLVARLCRLARAGGARRAG
jgi:DNA polymerase-3 subunit delta